METLFRKVLVTERLPDKGDRYFTNDGIRVYSPYTKRFLFTHQAIEYWLEPVELPSEDEMKKEAESYTLSQGENKKHFIGGFQICYNYILGFINNKN